MMNSTTQELYATGLKTNLTTILQTITLLLNHNGSLLTTLRITKTQLFMNLMNDSLLLHHFCEEEMTNSISQILYARKRLKLELENIIYNKSQQRYDSACEPFGTADITIP